MGQIIISVGREFGSGGRVIAEALAKRFDLPIYDRHLILEIAEKTGASTATISRVNRSLNYGSDGYELIFERLAAKKENN